MNKIYIVIPIFLILLATSFLIAGTITPDACIIVWTVALSAVAIILALPTDNMNKIFIVIPIFLILLATSFLIAGAITPDACIIVWTVALSAVAIILALPTDKK